MRNNKEMRKLERIFLTYKIMTGRVNLLVYILPLLIFIPILFLYVTTEYRHMLPSLAHYFLPAAIAFLLMIVVTPVVMFIARRYNILDKSKEPLVPTPLLGGVSIYIGFLIVLLLYQPLSPQTLAILIGATIILVMGTIDDITPLSSVVRLVGQLAASFVVISAGLKVSFMPDTILGETIAVVITLIWILGIVNATNFADGVDGLATGFSLIAAVFFFLITLHLQQLEVSLITAVFAGSCLGFLLFNFYPAKIYLGDGGSTFLGFLLATFALYGGWSDKGPIIALGIPVLILGVLIFDMIYITISRIKNGKVKNFRQWLDYRGQDHFHHRLINLGFKESEAVLFIYITTLILGFSSLIIEHAQVSYPVLILIIQATLIFINITILMLEGRYVAGD